MKTQLKKKLRKGVFIAFIVSAIFILMGVLNIFQIFELKSLDLRFRLRGPIKPHPDIIMVDIADDAIEEFGQWPFPRHFHGLFIDAAKDIGASQVIFDIYFSKQRNIESDRFLGNMAKEAGNVIFALKFFPHIPNETFKSDTSNDILINRFTLKQKPGKENKGMFIADALIDIPIEPVANSAKYMGFINTKHDIDGVSRRTPAVLKYNGKYFLQLDLPAIAYRFDINPADIEFNPGKSIVFKNAKIDKKTEDVTVPLDKDGNIIINWVGGWKDIKHYSYRDILVSYKLISEGQEPIIPIEELQSLKDKILIISHVESASHDYYPIPFEKEYFLPGLQYSLINTILTRQFIIQHGFIFTFFLIIFLCIILAYIIYYTPPNLRHLTSILFLILFLLASYFAFSKFNIWIKTVSPSLAIIITFSAIMFSRYLDELKTKKQIKLAFQKYVTKDVMEQLLQNPDKLMSICEKRNLTVLFSDIRGFTSMSEKHPPEVLVNILNEYLGSMTNVVFDYNGTIDKFVGDEIMAYFGAPLNPDNHAKRAVQTAVAMNKRIAELQDKWKAENKQLISIGIGINTGDVVIGNVGSEQYMDFTLIGDNVNLGARLCSAAKANEILISDSTYLQVSRHVEVVHVDAIEVKGKRKPVKIYSIMNFIDNIEKEKRKHKRSGAEIEIYYRPFNSKGDYKTKIVNISGGGFKMVGKEKENVGAQLSAVIPLPNKIIIKDIVVNVLECIENADGLWETRTEFMKIRDQDRDEIVKFIYYYRNQEN